MKYENTQFRVPHKGCEMTVGSFMEKITLKSEFGLYNLENILLFKEEMKGKE